MIDAVYLLGGILVLVLIGRAVYRRAQVLRIEREIRRNWTRYQAREMFDE